MAGAAISVGYLQSGTGCWYQRVRPGGGHHAPGESQGDHRALCVRGTSLSLLTPLTWSYVTPYTRASAVLDAARRMRLHRYVAAKGGWLRPTSQLPTVCLMPGEVMPLGQCASFNITYAPWPANERCSTPAIMQGSVRPGHG